MSVRVVKVRDGGVVRKVLLLDDDGCAIDAPCQFLEHQSDRGSSPNTLCAYGYDLKRLFTFLRSEQLDWRRVRPGGRAAVPRLPTQASQQAGGPAARDDCGGRGRFDAGSAAFAGDGQPRARRGFELLRLGDRH